MEKTDKIKRLKKNKEYCKKVSEKGSYLPLYEKYYSKIIKKIKEGN